jgi:KDO2-lipid IV(A) lauroyltransferase
VKKIIRKISEGYSVLIIRDQAVNPGYGIEYPFFGKEAYHTDIVRLLSKKYDIYIVPTYIVKKDKKYVIYFHEPFKPDENRGSIEREVAILEQEIRKRADEWLWCHRRWKHKYDYKGDE